MSNLVDRLKRNILTFKQLSYSSDFTWCYRVIYLIWTVSLWTAFLSTITFFVQGELPPLQLSDNEGGYICIIYTRYIQRVMLYTDSFSPTIVVSSANLTMVLMGWMGE